MTECSDCTLPEHDPKYYSWKFVSPLALSNEILALNSPDAWKTSSHVHFIETNGCISSMKGHEAIGSSKFVQFPPIPGLRLSFRGERSVTFAADFDADKQEALHKRLATAVAIEVMQRGGLLTDRYGRIEKMVHMLLNGLPFEDVNVERVRSSDDKSALEYEISGKRVEPNKRKVDEDDDEEQEDIVAKKSKQDEPKKE